MGEGEMNKFVNPYNFIPLEGERAEYAGIKENEQLFTGEITYTVLIKEHSPLFIPCTEPETEVIQVADETEQVKAIQHKKYDFFSYGDGRPIIPGSEIRGMLRGNFEMLTNSCLSSLESDMQLSKRTGEVFRKGLIKKENDTYLLYEANACRCKPRYTAQIQEAKKVWYDKKNSWAQNVSVEKGSHYLYGYLIKGYIKEDRKKGEKTWHHVFYLKKGNEPKSISLDVLDRVLDEYKKYKKNTYEEYAEALKKFKSGEGEEHPPVYYSEVGETIYLSPACITREIYHNTLKDCARTYVPCESREGMCPTCALFGMLGGKGESITSRLRFSDLVSSDYEYGEAVTLKERLSPRLNNTEFYLKRPSEDAIFWTYDYYIKKDGTLVLYTPEFNGRKFYWHKLNVERADYLGQKSELNATVKPVVFGSFKGTMYFSNISKTELKQLVWLLNAGEYGDIELKEHGYKLGAAKPLGFGSVAISVDKILRRQVSLGEKKVSVEYVPLTDEDEDLMHPIGCFSEKIEVLFRKATAFNTVGSMDVSYPYVESKNENGYEWFLANHKAYVKGEIKNFANSRNRMLFQNYLEAMEPKVQKTLAEDKLKKRG